ncbi:hypothetical protein CJ030_MR2G012889 [Morella rubra]|uniref:Uncharacterized protein n=1 Tax=Morella rubra TaxID=262757 RepID=A0A6A1WEW4_9ROSI|nr:hypothetical protein CJ030_MR2G012889 [Morella rubra]
MDRHCTRGNLSSPDILAAFMGLQRPIKAHPTVEMANKPDAEDIFCTFTQQNVVLFLRSVGCMDSSNEERKVPIGPICRTTLSSFEAQFRRQQQALVPIQQQEVEEPPRHSHDQERPTWADAWMVDLKGMVASASVVRRLGDPCFLYRDSDDGIATIPQYHSRHLMCDVEDVGRH